MKMTKKQLREYEVIDQSKKSKEHWNKYELDGRQFELLGTFKNEFNELFVIYHEKNSLAIYITGDELGWESGWLLNPISLEIKQSFYMSKEELLEAFKIVKKLKTAI